MYWVGDIGLTFPFSLATKGTNHLEVPIITYAHKTEHSTSAAFHGWKPEWGPKTGYLIPGSGSWLAEVMIWQKFTNVRENRISIGHLWGLFSSSLNSQPLMPWSRTEHHSSITDPTPHYTTTLRLAMNDLTLKTAIATDELTLKSYIDKLAQTL